MYVCMYVYMCICVSQEGVKEKIFINIVSSDKIMKPSKQVAKDGTNWSLPYSLGRCIYVHIYMYIRVYVYIICLYYHLLEH